ncbi:MAG: hypothetical protein ACRCTE_09075 [Cellulosilyticaceae bacterium]
MKISFQQEELSGYIEGSIKLTNNSPDILQNIVLSFETISSHMIECKVVRERGSLCFTPPQSEIQLGNLYPDEVAYLYCKLRAFDQSNVSSPVYTEEIKVSFNPETTPVETHALSDFITVPIT